MKKEIGFGEQVEGFQIPVLNEREIRAASGILFLFALIALLLILFKKDFLVAKYFVTIFVLDFTIRVFITPKFSPTLIIGRMIVGNQTPEYVGAPQKKFAWKIGLFLSVTMFLLMNVLNTYSVITGLICLICLIFLFFEASFGICIGCFFYKLIYKEKVQYCPGEICEVKDRVAIQKVSKGQVFIVIGFICVVVAMMLLLKNSFASQPVNLWEKLGLK